MAEATNVDRFFTACDEVLNRLADKRSNANTKKSTGVWERVFQSWAQARNCKEQLQEYAPEELNKVLCKFFAEIRKQDGTNYEPDSLTVMLAAPDRKLLELGYPKSIKKDREFDECLQVLEGKARELREAGIGKKPNRARSPTKKEEEVLWSSGVLGKSTPRALINPMFWNFTQHFGWRGRQEHHDLKMDYFLTSKDNEGTEFVYFAEGPTKTRGHGLNKKHRKSLPKMFATGHPERCPALLFRIYTAHRPLPLRKTGLFYLSSNQEALIFGFV